MTGARTAHRSAHLGVHPAGERMPESPETPAAVSVSGPEARYRMLFDTLIEGFCTIEVIFDAAGKASDYRFLEINPAFEKQSGLRNAQGKRILEIAPDLESHWFEIFGRIALTGEPARFENEAKSLGRHFDVCAYRVGGAESRNVAILFTDITERKFAQRELQSQFDRLHLLHQIARAIGDRQDLHSIHQVVVGTLEDQLPVDFACFCDYDPASKQIVVARIGARSQPLAAQLELTEQSRMHIGAECLATAVRGEFIYEADTRLDPSPFPQRLAQGGLLAMVAAPLMIEGKIEGVLVVARRVAASFSSGEGEFLLQLVEQVALATHQAKLYGELRSAYDELRQSQQSALQRERLRALGQMASGIAHDINNAISPISLYAEALLEREKNLSTAGRGQLQIIQRAIDDVAATVARMREFHREREPQMLLAAVQLNELVPQVVELTRARWSDMPQQRGVMIELRTDLAPALPAIMGAENEIREALTNLVFNAVDALPDGGRLTIRTRATPPGNVEVEVSDTGVGMDESARRRCLEPFFTTKGERGTGLGLAMVYGMVKRHSAEIHIDSALGRGTTARLRFAAVARAIEATPAPADSVRLHGLRLLLVDDDPILLQSLRDSLEGDGHTITIANGGQEGIDLFRAAHASPHPFSAVISDLGMPYVDGRQVADAVKSVSGSTPVLLLTGWGRRIVDEGDTPKHVDAVLAKPPKLRDLRESLARYCTKQPG
ncbi:MAG: response regulator [Steroidobacteraceae bacterium]|nr:response regulator [Steroidobacteraceae bacterium]